MPLHWQGTPRPSTPPRRMCPMIRRLDARVGARSFDVKNDLAVWPTASPLEHFVSNVRITQG
jgi:hypothetical protein